MRNGLWPSMAPRLLSAVSGENLLAVASLESGAVMLAKVAAVAGRPEGGCCVAVGQRPGNGDALGSLCGIECDAADEEDLEPVDDLRLHECEVCDGFVPDALTFPP